jgi:Tfp pilus assembly protein PilF
MRARMPVAGLVALAVAACATTGGEDRLRVYTEGGVQLFHNGKYPEARDTFRAAIALKPDEPNLLYNLGQCHERLGQPKTAEETYLTCLRSAPNHPEGWHAITVLLVSGGRRDEAVRRVRDWMCREPKLGAPRAELGWLYGQDGDLHNAQWQLRDALAVDPNNLLALTELARLCEMKDRKDRALSLYQRALRVNPDQPELVRRVSLLRNQGVGPPRPD